jgi:K+-transporting ATPase KdpF subunit
MWLLPVSIIVFTIIIAVPLSHYMAKIMDGDYRAPGLLRWFEKHLDTGPLNWKQYTAALLIFNTVLFVYGYIVLSAQPWMPLNPRSNCGILQCNFVAVWESSILSSRLLAARLVLGVLKYDGSRFRVGDLCVLRNCDRIRTGVHPLMTPWELVLGSVMALGLTVYLVYAMLRPEKF